MYRQAFQQNRGGYGAAIALVLVVIITVAAIVQFRVLRASRAAT
jgi:ABC-type sugar transport system permease subunit